MLLVALGANLPDRYGRSPLSTCRWAAGRVAELSGLRLEAVSPWYRTAPVPASDQPDYVNGVLRLSGHAEPEALLALLHGVEAEAGRVRGEANAARVLDLDLLAADELVIERPGLIVPHPRLAERAFVLHPLCDVAPEWRHPVLGRTALELRDLVGSNGIVPAALPN
ncbi:MAG TPA: 2-amino-4-hydroxy-6-hydroxymethyldihydropteridine diphosphokinase [Acetobacteraceae bacterium]|nr:2-amino-4-hydroxy-6-hydroxymethyldihydropteridine diphosphokinase [Acetobacteraceae bacterium]